MYLALIQYDKVIACRLDILNYMCRQYHELVFSRVGKKMPKCHSFRRVKSDCRFVEDNKLGVSQQCLCDTDPLLLAAGEGAYFCLAFFLKMG
jgi:hypothetical protein